MPSLKTNLSPLKKQLKDDFPFEIVSFQGTFICFRGCKIICPTNIETCRTARGEKFMYRLDLPPHPRMPVANTGL